MAVFTKMEITLTIVAVFPCPQRISKGTEINPTAAEDMSQGYIDEVQRAIRNKFGPAVAVTKYAVTGEVIEA